MYINKKKNVVGEFAARAFTAGHALVVPITREARMIGAEPGDTLIVTIRKKVKE